MPEHTPAPTPDRGVYGFALFLLSHALFIIYVLWAFIPTKFLEDTLGLTYLPDKYFALYLPIMILCGVTFFAFFIYPSLNLAITPNIDDTATICDSHSIYKCQFTDREGRRCQDKVVESPDKQWNSEKFCQIHKFPRQIFEIHDDVNEITDKCDCPNNKSCLLREKPNHVLHLRNMRKVPTASDLDIADVCQLIHGD